MEESASGGELRVREERSICAFKANIHVTTKSHVNL